MPNRRSGMIRWFAAAAVAVALGVGSYLLVQEWDRPTVGAEPTPMLRFARAESHLEREPEQALAACRELLGLVPNYPGAHLLAAKAELALERLDAAEVSLRAAVATDPDDPEARELLGRVVLVRGGSFDEAVEHLLRAVELDVSSDTPPAADVLRVELTNRPDAIDIRYRLGRALLRQGSVIQAKIELQDVLQRVPNHAGAKAAMLDVQKALELSRRPATKKSG